MSNEFKQIWSEVISDHLIGSYGSVRFTKPRKKLNVLSELRRCVCVCVWKLVFTAQSFGYYGFVLWLFTWMTGYF